MGTGGGEGGKEGGYLIWGLCKYPVRIMRNHYQETGEHLAVKSLLQETWGGRGGPDKDGKLNLGVLQEETKWVGRWARKAPIFFKRAGSDRNSFERQRERGD